MEKLSLVLWRERELLEVLLYRLEIEQLVLANARTTWLGRATQDVEATLQALRETEVLRAVAAQEAAASVGSPDQASLRELAEASPEPWRSILTDHREAFASITQRVCETADANRDLITAGHRSARDLLMNMDEATEGYGSDGALVAAAPSQRVLDWSL